MKNKIVSEKNTLNTRYSGENLSGPERNTKGSEKYKSNKGKNISGTLQNEIGTGKNIIALGNAHNSRERFVF